MDISAVLSNVGVLMAVLSLYSCAHVHEQNVYGPLSSLFLLATVSIVGEGCVLQEYSWY